ncbi:hypothetical protein [Sinosporangium siamense]|nr:hypothetical protein [Sinosporangium siamense]
MSLAHVQDLIGPFDHRQEPPSAHCLHIWQDLELLVDTGTGLVVQVGLLAGGWGELRLPAALGGVFGTPEMGPSVDAVLRALDKAGVTWSEAPEQVVGDEARVVRVEETGVLLHFHPYEGKGCPHGDAGLLALHCATRSA